MYRIMMGRQTWHFEESKPGVVKTMFIRFAHEKIAVPGELFEKLTEYLYNRLDEFVNGPPPPEPEKPAHHGAGGDVEAAAALAEEREKEAEAREGVEEMISERRYQRRKAIVLTYVAWGILTWMIFVCACPRPHTSRAAHSHSLRDASLLSRHPPIATRGEKAFPALTDTYVCSVFASSLQQQTGGSSTTSWAPTPRPRS